MEVIIPGGKGGEGEKLKEDLTLLMKLKRGGCPAKRGEEL